MKEYIEIDDGATPENDNTEEDEGEKVTQRLAASASRVFRRSRNFFNTFNLMIIDKTENFMLGKSFSLIVNTFKGTLQVLYKS